MKEEVAAMKLRVKTLQSDLAAGREEVKALKQCDPIKMKKNLDENKKKLAEKTSDLTSWTGAFWPDEDLLRQ